MLGGDVDAGVWLRTILSIGVGFVAAIFAEPIRRRFYRPVVQLDFRHSDDFVTPTPEYVGEKEYSARYVRIKALNTSPGLAKACRVFLVNVEKEVSFGRYRPTVWCDSLQLQWSARFGEAFDAIDLPSEVPQFIDVISTQEGSFQFEFKVKGLPFRYRGLLGETTTYLLTLQLVGDGVKPATLKLKFKWTGDWQGFIVTRA